MNQIFDPTYERIIPTFARTSYVYHIDVEGLGGETCFAPVPEHLIEHMKSRTPAYLAEMVQSTNNPCFMMGGVSADLPFWTDHERVRTFWGVDTLREHVVTISDAAGNVLKKMQSPFVPPYGLTPPYTVRPTGADLQVNTYQEMTTRYVLELDEPLRLELLMPCFDYVEQRSFLSALQYGDNCHGGVWLDVLEIENRSAKIVLYN